MRVFAAFFLLFLTFPALAQDVPASCDIAIYTKMNDRATMLGQQDMKAAKNFIRQAPSVLDLACIDGGTCDQMATLWQAAKCDNFTLDDFLGMDASESSPAMCP